MAMRFASLGSGSAGNGLVVQAGGTTALLDCGFGLRDTEARLERLGLSARQVDAILITHEHSDHCQGVKRFARRHGVPVWASHGTLSMLEAMDLAPDDTRPVEDDHAFGIGELSIHPFAVPHDAREPLQFVFSDGARRLGVLTDAGDRTAHIEAMLTKLDALVLECNHDADMLARGPYPPALKRRVAGSHGHLSNEQAERLLARLERGALQHVIAAHVSTTNNTSALAIAALERALDSEPGWVAAADQDTGFGWRHIA
jgi:phosphoribosyl 1,2-cyclic phosphodiesterase